jgi:hypothetical protein
MHGTHCLGNALSCPDGRLSSIFWKYRMFEKTCSTVEDEGGELFFFRILLQLVCFSGQPAQLTPASAAGFKLTSNIVAVHNKQFFCRPTVGRR